MIFPHWSSIHAPGLQIANEPYVEAVFSADAKAVNSNSLLVQYDCVDNRPVAVFVGGQEARQRGPYFMLCPPYTRRFFYEKFERGIQTYTLQTKARCERLPDKELPEGIRAGLTDCFNIRSKLPGYARLKAVLTNSTPTHPVKVNTAASKDALISPAAAKGVSITIISVEEPWLNPIHNQDQLMLQVDTVTTRDTYRVCAHAPPGHGNWDLWITMTSV